jgi:hypothetical protein
MTRQELNKLATAVKKQKDEAAALVLKEQRAKFDKDVKELETRCRQAMKEAAQEGKFSCEVTCGSREVAGKVADILSEFDPKFNGDGYWHEVICLSFK